MKTVVDATSAVLASLLRITPSGTCRQPPQGQSPAGSVKDKEEHTQRPPAHRGLEDARNDSLRQAVLLQSGARTGVGHIGSRHDGGEDFKGVAGTTFRVMSSSAGLAASSSSCYGCPLLQRVRRPLLSRKFSVVFVVSVASVVLRGPPWSSSVVLFSGKFSVFSVLAVLFASVLFSVFVALLFVLLFVLLFSVLFGCVVRSIVLFGVRAKNSLAGHNFSRRNINFRAKIARGALSFPADDEDDDDEDDEDNDDDEDDEDDDEDDEEDTGAGEEEGERRKRG